MTKLKVLLTGAGGRIGPHLVPAFLERYDLTLLDLKPLPYPCPTVVSDLQDIGVLREAMAGVDVVVHLAATSDEAPFVENLVPNNVVGVYNVFQAACDAGVRRIVFAGTVQSVTPWEMENPVKVSDPPRPHTLYGATKILGEAMGRYYHDRHGREFVGVRIGAFQPYDSELLTHRGFRELWLSPKDAVTLFQCAIETPEVGYAVVFGTSRTSRERLSLQEAKDQLGYEPSDDARDLPQAQAERA